MSDTYGYILACLCCLMFGFLAGTVIERDVVAQDCKRQASFYTRKEDFQCSLKAKP